ncbi:SDR family oxidoreductase [Nonomuraea sp. 3-1Str]|uniref:SDR family NAD(P)-dependent oxidoreductase n=1 Tax=Nonomuraea sp. 3-1Str TaxID=2929801 RepID=UPI002854CC9C|nr:SDR family oxidoreductase [Nonomuraea sp. 3-1Str]MDR8407311.1 SDR family oxidoreductase [Nonomuraea sp. 3-1Str]
MIDTGLAGQVVLVTGGGRGIGAAIARAFAAEGARVAVHGFAGSAPPPGVTWEHLTPPLDEAEELAAGLGGGAIAVRADLMGPDAPVRLFDVVESRLGPVDVLVNNAAHCESPDTFDTVTAAGLARAYQVNAIAPTLLIAELARRRRPGHSASAVNVSTDAARAFPGQVGYGTSKAALEALTRAAALDLAAAGIRVNAVAPGPVQTGWMDAATEEHVRSIVPLGRAGEPADIAGAVVFLASRQARYITGQVLQVAGGHAL